MRQPGTAFSEELLALFDRADTARRQAERLLEENDRWRRCVAAQLDYMFELGSEFRQARRSLPPR